MSAILLTRTLITYQNLLEVSAATLKLFISVSFLPLDTNCFLAQMTALQKSGKLKRTINFRRASLMKNSWLLFKKNLTNKSLNRSLGSLE
jgi:hypothetical protein